MTSIAGGITGWKTNKTAIKKALTEKESDIEKVEITDYKEDIKGITMIENNAFYTVQN